MTITKYSLPDIIVLCTPEICTRLSSGSYEELSLVAMTMLDLAHATHKPSFEN